MTDMLWINRQETPLIVALDFNQEQRALNLVSQLDPTKCRLKVGKEAFTLFGPAFVKKLHNKGFEVFLDLKFHDIPNTCAKAVQAAAELGVWMVNIHVSGGMEMMERSRKQLEQFGSDRPKLIGVTILTSFSEEDFALLGYKKNLQEQVLQFVDMAHLAGLDGVVCSAHEARIIKMKIKNRFDLVTPGIRLDNSDIGDQKRIMTPDEAIRAGSDYIVVGRPITQSPKPMETVEKIINTIL